MLIPWEEALEISVLRNTSALPVDTKGNDAALFTKVLVAVAALVFSDCRSGPVFEQAADCSGGCLSTEEFCVNRKHY